MRISVQNETIEPHGHLIEYIPGQRFQTINTTGVQCIDNQYIYVLSHCVTSPPPSDKLVPSDFIFWHGFEEGNDMRVVR